MVLLARDISKQIENQMEYPGQIKVSIVRESRAVDYANVITNIFKEPEKLPRIQNSWQLLFLMFCISIYYNISVLYYCVAFY